MYSSSPPVECELMFCFMDSKFNDDTLNIYI